MVGLAVDDGRKTLGSGVAKGSDGDRERGGPSKGLVSRDLPVASWTGDDVPGLVALHLGIVAA